MGEVESYPHCELRQPPRKAIADAAEEIAKRLGIDPMEAWKKLIGALYAADIKAYWRQSSNPDHHPIAADRWPRAHIEIAKQTVIFANGERMILVDLDRDAYERWLAKIAVPVAIDLPAKGKRYVGDDELVAEGVEGLRTHRWPNAYQAATKLAERARGPATQKSKADRLYRKIQAARDSGADPLNIPKHPE
jgi:hypothetical protein